MFLETGTHADIFGWQISDSNHPTIDNDEMSLDRTRLIKNKQFEN